MTRVFWLDRIPFLYLIVWRATIFGDIGIFQIIISDFIIDAGAASKQWAAADILQKLIMKLYNVLT